MVWVLSQCAHTTITNKTNCPHVLKGCLSSGQMLDGRVCTHPPPRALASNIPHSTTLTPQPTDNWCTLPYVPQHQQTVAVTCSSAPHPSHAHTLRCSWCECGLLMLIATPPSHVYEPDEKLCTDNTCVRSRRSSLRRDLRACVLTDGLSHETCVEGLSLLVPRP